MPQVDLINGFLRHKSSLKKNVITHLSLEAILFIQIFHQRFQCLHKDIQRGSCV